MTLTQIFQETLNYFSQLPLIELAAVITALIYVVLAAKGNIWCWPAAFISTILYTMLFYDVYLWMDSLLQIYYMVMAVYGWYCWRQSSVTTQSQPKLKPKSKPQVEAQTLNRLNENDNTKSQPSLDIQTWSAQCHIKIIIGLAFTSAIVGWGMATFTPADFPYFDAATTVFAVFATYLVTKKVLENWLYWVVIDFVSIYIYIEKGLMPTAVLFALYVILAGYGYLQWLNSYKEQRETPELSFSS